jgi:uncharacterized membrane protein
MSYEVNAERDHATPAQVDESLTPYPLQTSAKIHSVCVYVCTCVSCVCMCACVARRAMRVALAGILSSTPINNDNLPLFLLITVARLAL